MFLHGLAVNENVIKKTRTKCQKWGLSKSFKAARKVDGALARPNGITRNS